MPKDFKSFRQNGGASVALTDDFASLFDQAFAPRPLRDLDRPELVGLDTESKMLALGLKPAPGLGDEPSVPTMDTDLMRGEIRGDEFQLGEALRFTAVETIDDLKEAMFNVPESGFQLVKDVASAVRHPITTAKSLGGLAVGLVQKIIPGEQDQERYVDGLVEHFSERYGGAEKVRTTFIKDPVGFVSDVALFLSAGGVSLKAAGKVSKLPSVTKAGQSVLQTARAIEPITATAKAAKAVVKAPTTAAKVVLEPLVKFGKKAEDTMAKAIDIAPSDARKIMKPTVANTTAEKWLLERGIKGTAEKIINKLDDVSEQSKAFLDEQVTKIGGQYTNKTVNKAINILKESLDGIDGLEDELAKLKELGAKQRYSLAEINQVKRLIDDNLDIFKASAEVKGGLKAKGLSNIRSSIKKFIEAEGEKAGVPIKDINKQTQVSRAISDAIKKAQPRIAKREAVSLSDIGVAGVGFTINPAAGLGLFLTKKLTRSTKFRSALANRLSKLPKKQLLGIEEAAKAGKGLSKELAQIMRKVSLDAVKDMITGIRGLGLPEQTQEQPQSKELEVQP